MPSIYSPRSITLRRKRILFLYCNIGSAGALWTIDHFNEPVTNESVPLQPAIDAISVELPAGLIDEGESPAEAAIRELREETGYKQDESTTVNISEVSTPCADSPGELAAYQDITWTSETLASRPAASNPTIPSSLTSYLIGMSTESTIFVTVEITLPQGTGDFPTPKQNLDEGEFVSIFPFSIVI